MINCKSFKYCLSKSALEKIYRPFILPRFDYAGVTWDNCTLDLSQQLEDAQLHAVTGTSNQKRYLETDFIPPSQR